MDRTDCYIHVQGNEARTKWSFKVFNSSNKLIGQGTGFRTGLVAEKSAKQFIDWYVEGEDS